MSDPRYTDLEPRRVRDPDATFMGMSSGMLLGILAVLIIAGGLIFYWNSDTTTVANRPADNNTGTVTRSAPAPTAPSNPTPAPSTTPARP